MGLCRRNRYHGRLFESGPLHGKDSRFSNLWLYRLSTTRSVRLLGGAPLFPLALLFRLFAQDCFFRDRQDLAIKHW